MTRFLFLYALFPVLALGAQSGDPPLPRGFESLLLGLDRTALDEALKIHPSFLYRGAPDATLLDRPNESLIEAEGSFYLRRGWFQLRGDRLYLITLDLDPRRLDYYTLFTTLSEKYGPPDSLDPHAARWDDGSTLVTLEKPLRLKYIDKAVWDARLAETERRTTNEALGRELFLVKF